MKKKARKPKGWNKFKSLLKNISDVPKEEVDAKEAERKKRKPRTG